MSYLVVRNISVQGANAINGMLGVGYPAMTAFSGLGHAIFRHYNDLTGDTAALQRFAVVHHDGEARLYGDRNKRLSQKRTVHTSSETPDRSGYYFSPSSELMPQCALRVSLVLQGSFDHTATVRLAACGDTRNLLDPRILGGVLQPIQKDQLFWVHDDLEAFQRTPPGWVLVDRTPTLFPDDTTAQRDCLDVLLDLLSVDASVPARERTQRIPSQIGYRAISKGARRRGARNPEVDHYFVEPVIGLVEFTRKYAAFEECDDKLDRLFWTPRIDRATGLFTCSASGQNER